MLRKVQDIIGLPVLDLGTGKKIGKVNDIFFGTDHELKAVAMDAKHWFSSSRFIAWDDVAGFGDDAVTIENELVIRSFEDSNPWFAFLSGNRKLKEIPVITVNGNQLGLVSDVYFDPEEGTKMIGVELTDGFISDLKEGRKWLRLPGQLTLGDDSIVVPAECEEALEEIIQLKR
ncbi:PRC-barrel domain-containing protein [Paenibacillus gansuensis]|uniref:PRC-barrel domain-containing protein n=1 Tax=Paenibacillus gansuensis TaxID=306542 RepID=A0ABW5PBP2_9BACL